MKTTAFSICLWAAACSGAQSDLWTFIGPRPTGKDANATSGRVTAIAVNSSDPLTAYLGSAGGGVWKTVDGGLNWVTLTNYEPSLVIGSIALDPSDQNTLYIGTGEANACYDCYFGAGILKSTDAGTTWRQLRGPFIDQLGRGARVGSIAVSPFDRNVVTAAVYFVGADGVPGIYRSSDGGESWTAVLSQNQGTAVLFDSVHPGIAYAGVYGQGVFQSADAGLTWKQVNGVGSTSLPVAKGGRVDLALAPSSPETLYAAIANTDASGGGGSLGVYKTTDSGGSWSRLGNLPDYCLPQCGYNSVLAVDPANANTVYVGGIDLYKTLDGGQTWKSIRRGNTTVVPGSYQHAIALAGDSSRIYVGNDSGVYSSVNPGSQTATWSNLNSTLGIAQFAGGVSIHPADAKKGWGGAQGSGVQRYAGNMQWEPAVCQDGGNTVIDFTNPSNVYASCQRTRILRSANAGASWSLATNGIDLSDRVQPAPPLIADPANQSRLYFGTYRLYQSNDGAGSWTPISPDLAGGTAAITTIAVAPSDRDVVYVGTTNGHVQITGNASAGPSVFWTDLSGSLPSRAISKLAVNAANPFVVYAAFSGFESGKDVGHIFQITGIGRDWLNISGDLPNQPVNDLLVDPDIPGTLYVGTDTGVFRTTDGGLHWLPLGNGLPRAMISGLTLHRATRTLRVATHGRGAWDLSIPLPPNATGTPALVSLSPAQAAPGAPSSQVVIAGTGFLPGSVARWNGADRPTTYVSGAELQLTASREDLSVPGRFEVTVSNPAPGGGESNALTFVVAAAPKIPPGSVVDAAGFQARPVAPGSLVSIFGNNLAFSSISAGAVPLPVSLGGTTLGVGGIPAPLLFVSAGQITFQIPWELSGLDFVMIAPSVAGVDGNTQSVRLADFSPGIFTLDGPTLDSPKAQAAVLIANSTILAAPSSFRPGARAAMRGEAISIYCTGLGDVTNRPPSGAAALADPLSVTFASPVVNIGNSVASAAFAGLAPGLVGTYVVNVRVPEDASTGDAVPLFVSVGATKSNIATVAIQ